MYIKEYIVLLFISLCLTSCATLMNDDSTSVHVQTLPDSARLVINHSDTVCCTPLTVTLERSDKTVKFEMIKDTIRKTRTITPQLDYWYLLGDYIFIPGMVGHIVDLTNNKRFTYPEKVTIEFNKSEALQIEPGDDQLPINFIFSFSGLNHLYSRNDKDHGHDYGFVSFEAGLEYYVSKQTYISAQVGNLTTLPILYFPLTDGPSPDREGNIVYFSSLRLNNKIGLIHLGTGISFQIFHYILDVNPPEFYLFSPNKHIDKISRGLGLSYSCQYIHDDVGIGIFFQPMLYNITESNFEYQSYWGIEVIGKFNLKNLW